MMKKSKAMDEKTAGRLLNWNIVLYLIGLYAIAYLGGDHDYISYREGITAFILLTAVNLAVLAVVFLHASREKRAQYLVLVALSGIFILVKYFFF